MKEKGIRIGVAKIGLDIVCVVLAILLGGEIGVGTVVCTLGLGPVVDLFYGWLQKIQLSMESAWKSVDSF